MGLEPNRTCSLEVGGGAVLDRWWMKEIDFWGFRGWDPFCCWMMAGVRIKSETLLSTCVWGSLWNR
jgi:hypothetical protein